MAPTSPQSNDARNPAQPDAASNQVPAEALVHFISMVHRYQTTGQLPVLPQDLAGALRDAGLEAAYVADPSIVGPVRSVPPSVNLSAGPGIPTVGPASHSPHAVTVRPALGAPVLSDR